MRLRTDRPVRARALLCAVVLPCLLAACGSSAQNSNGSGGRTTVTRTVTQTVSHASTTGAAGTQVATSATSQAAVSQCVAADLTLSFLGGNGATGHAELGFALRNSSSHSCRTGGYPGIQFLSGSGQPLATHPDHTTSDFFGQTKLQELTVAPGATVSFRLGVSHVGAGGSNAGCVTAKAVQVIAPNDTALMHVSVNGGIAECGGTVSVSPIQPGTTAMH